jgi:hypothetical protein
MLNKIVTMGLLGLLAAGATILPQYNLITKHLSITVGE